MTSSTTAPATTRCGRISPRAVPTTKACGRRSPSRAGWGSRSAEAEGGVGLGWVEAAVLLEQVGRHTAPVPFLPSLLALTVLSAAEQPSPEWVAGLATGERIGCVAWSKHADAVVAERAGDGWTLSGRIGPVEGAAVADIAVVVTSGRCPGRRPGSGRASAGRACDGWHPGAVVAALRRHARHVSRGRGPWRPSSSTVGAIGAAAEMLGGSDRVLEMAVQYAKDRVQFDQPIGSFQAIKHRCADMVVDVEGMRSATWYAAWAISAGDPDASAAASTTKVWSSDAAKRVMASGLQVHGGIGFTWEHDLHLYMKRSQFDRLNFGDAGFHRERSGGAPAVPPGERQQRLLTHPRPGPRRMTGSSRRGSMQ